MPRSTVVLLIALRLAIGWHFLYEGLQKIRSHEVGETVTSKPFSSAAYFREAPGPLGKAYRYGLGDPDSQALARLEVKPIPEGEDPANDKPGQRMPPGLKADWWAYVDAFEKHYGPDEQQRKAAYAKVEQAEAKVVLWLSESTVTPATKEVKKTFPSGEVKRQIPTGERAREYKAKLDEIHDTLNRKLWLFGRDVEGARLRKTKADAAEMRAGLLKDLDEQTQAMKKSLEDVLTPEQKAKGPVAEVKEPPIVTWIDWLTRWGLAVIGACLIGGLLTRTNCWLAAGFLLMTCLAVPALPWLPAVGPSEGNYLFVNKNVIEMLALMVLGTTASGRWFGVDALLHRVVQAVRGARPAPRQPEPVAA